MRAGCQKRLIRLVSTLHGIANCIKNGTIRTNVPPAYDSISPQCHSQLLSDRIENLIPNIFRNENSTLEINVSLFGVLHCQQWQPFASAPENNKRDMKMYILVSRRYSAASNSKRQVEVRYN